ncbi:MAG: peptidoglycan-binding protein [Candidatus Faecousia sp.]|nr:peptidoglycan-binding protein [Candidatus Faecousia sp.]
MTTTQVQSLLTYLGYNPGGVDGAYGEKTEAAVKAFQAAEGLNDDGVAGKLTWAALVNAVSQGRVYKPPDTAGKKETSGGPSWWADIKHFSRDEAYISCPCGKCGGFPREPAEKLMRLADAVREAAGRPMVPTSTVRCASHNAAVNGVWNSRHLLGHAMDFTIPGMRSSQVLEIVRKQPNVVYCYAIDSSAVHMDVGN